MLELNSGQSSRNESDFNPTLPIIAVYLGQITWVLISSSVNRDNKQYFAHKVVKWLAQYPACNMYSISVSYYYY